MHIPAVLVALLIVAAGPALAQHDHAPPPSQAPLTWTKLPVVDAALKGRMGVELTIGNSAATTIAVTPPAGQTAIVEARDGKAAFKPEIGNYHLVSAIDACDTHVATASTAVYFSNPGPAPTKSLAQPRQGLTIAPDKLPREHAAYRAGERWRFLVTMDGQPLPGTKVRFETANGTRTELVSDLDGRVTVTFPDDFAPRDQRPPEAHGRPTQAPFVLAAIMQTGALQHVGAFNYLYRPNAYDGSSLWAGAGFGFAGMVLAAPLLRRRTKGGAK